MYLCVLCRSIFKNLKVLSLMKLIIKDVKVGLYVSKNQESTLVKNI